MKEFDKKPIADQVNYSDQRQVEKKKKFLGSMRQIPGLSLFEYNLKTKELNKVELHKSTFISSDGKTKTVSKVPVKENCIYVQALNMKNAIKKLKRDYKF